MATPTIHRKGIEDIIRGFDAHAENCPYYALFESRGEKPGMLIYPYTGEDKERGREILAQNLETIEATGSTAIYLMRFYKVLDKNENITSRTEDSGAFRFRVLEPENKSMLRYETIGNAPVIAGPGQNNFLEFLIKERDILKEKNEELESENEQLKEDIRAMEAAPQEGGADLGVIGMIGEAGNRFPWMQNIVKDLGYIVAKATTRQNNEIPQAIAGLPSDATPDQRVNGAIGVLLEYYVSQAQGNKAEGFSKFADDMELLAKMTVNPLDFNYAISKLRENFKK